MSALRLVVWSDYLCPWCYLASARLERLAAEEEGLELVWKAFLLRPRPGERRDLLDFHRYTQSWLRPAAEPDAPTYRVWESGEGPPTHSVPPHRVARAAASLGPDAFREVHHRLLRAYFEESRDITAEATLRAVWAEAGLAGAEFARALEPARLEEVLAEHRQALELGVTGVPAVQPEGHDAFVLGAQPLATYRRWIGRLRAGVLHAGGAA